MSQQRNVCGRHETVTWSFGEIPVGQKFIERIGGEPFYSVKLTYDSAVFVTRHGDVYGEPYEVSATQRVELP
jgi:hypothetical protein